MIVYATPTDLAAWTGSTAPSNALKLLRSASILVSDATSSAIYQVDSGQLPVDAGYLDALRDATCAQAAAWAALGVDPTPGPAGTAAPVKSSSILSGSVTYDTAVSEQDTVTQLVPEALYILRQAGLLNGEVIVYG